MAHELTIRQDGTAEMMYVGEKPWHGLGKELNAPATAKEAIEAAQLDWNVVKRPIYAEYPDDDVIRIPDKAAVVRSDNKSVLGVVGLKYKPVQNVEAFGFFDAVVAQGEAIYHTAGSLKGGRKVFILAQLPGDLKLADDLINRYILLVNSHDGSEALQMMQTRIRVVCNNTLNVALSEGKSRFYARHTPNIMSKANLARDVVGLAAAYDAIFMRKIEQLAQKAWTQHDLEQMVAHVFKFDDEKDFTHQNAQKRAVLETVQDLFVGGMGNEGKTAWDAFNAVTEYIDHERPMRGNHFSENDKRVDASWFGSLAVVRQSTFDYLLEKSKN